MKSPAFAVPFSQPIISHQTIPTSAKQTKQAWIARIIFPVSQERFHTLKQLSMTRVKRSYSSLSQPKDFTVNSLLRESASAPLTFESASATAASSGNLIRTDTYRNAPNRITHAANSAPKVGCSMKKIIMPELIIKKLRRSSRKNVSTISSKESRKRDEHFTSEPANASSKKRIDCFCSAEKLLRARSFKPRNSKYTIE